EASGTQLEIQQLSNLLVMPEQKRLLLDGFLETEIASGVRGGIGGTSGRQETVIETRRQATQRAWAGYDRNGEMLEIATERAAGRFSLSGTAGYQRVLSDSDRVGVFLHALQAAQSD